jgi:AcrR family transcriptional regulator/DNA-binding MarR family transcriptional regulator
MASGRQGAREEPATVVASPGHEAVGGGHPGGRRRSEGTASGGQDRLAHDQLGDIQRGRIVSAMLDVASELGAGNATVARVVARSGVSRRTFYEQFPDREECFLAAFDYAVAQLAAVVVPAYEQPGTWQARIRAALAVLLEALDSQPAVARVVLAESLGAGPKALARRRNVQLQIIPILDLPRAGAKRSAAPPPLTAEGIAGGVLSLIHSRLLSGEGPFVELLNPLMAMIVLPYLRPAAARRELARPVPPAAPASNGHRDRTSDPLRNLDMRLTYRTIRVLEAIGALGGQGSHPSNRQVADAAGIRDQGQVSKLLARLQQLGLIEKASEPHVKGEPNAWRLTPRGSEVRRVVSG